MSKKNRSNVQEIETTGTVTDAEVETNETAPSVVAVEMSRYADVVRPTITGNIPDEARPAVSTLCYMLETGNLQMPDGEMVRMFPAEDAPKCYVEPYTEVSQKLSKKTGKMRNMKKVTRAFQIGEGVVGWWMISKTEAESYAGILRHSTGLKVRVIESKPIVVKESRKNAALKAAALMGAENAVIFDAEKLPISSAGRQGRVSNKSLLAAFAAQARAAREKKN